MAITLTIIRKTFSKRHFVALMLCKSYSVSSLQLSLDSDEVPKCRVCKTKVIEKCAES